MKAIIVSNRQADALRVYTETEVQQIGQLFDCDGKYYTEQELQDADVIFSTWGMPKLTEQQIREKLPSLKAIFYGAGTVKYFAEPYLNCGVQIFSAWQANAIPVIETCLAQILLANKGFFHLAPQTKQDYKAARKEVSHFPGNYAAKVGLIGLGAIGMGVQERLKQFDLDIYVYSSKVTKENESQWGVKAATLEEIFSQCNVISNHLANVPATVGILNDRLFQLMQPYTTFINTGRGAQVDEEALINKVQKDPSIVAILDVTHPEPPLDDSPLYTLPNVILTPHSAGSSGNEVRRMAQYMIDESHRWINGETCLYEVKREMLPTMA